ncbi:MAG: protein kinase domain-containing protein [Planctomycetota bacterium]
MRLTVENGPRTGTVVALDRDQPTTIGSAPECGLRIAEPGVAPQQAVIKALKDQGFGVKALAPGVRLNGREVEVAALADGDVLEVGATRIAFGEAPTQAMTGGLPEIPGYRILGQLGRGGMGMVYRAEQTSLHREVALKVLNRELTKDPAFVGKFVAEARAAAKLQHPNVVQVFDVANAGETYFYAMELMHDGSLEGWLKKHGAMPEERALQAIADAAAGLAYAESLRLVHRDIKPDNLMLDQHGTVKIVDLGLAGATSEAEEKAVGTPHFMAPEQVLKQAVDHRTDLYALGCTFYRLVTGRTPFRGQSVKDILRAQVKDEAEPANKANPQVSAETTAIVQKLMAKEPAARFQSADELLEAVQTLQQPPAKKGLWIGLAAAAALVAGGAIWWAVTKPVEKEIVEKVYDDPEKQQFADEIKALKKEQRADKATIALLTARASAATGEDLAKAFDEVAANHAGTPAADEAKQRSERIRTELADARQRAAQRQQRVADHATAVRQAAQAPQQAGDFAAALRALEAPPAAELADDADWKQRQQALRDEVLAAARAQLRDLVAAVGDAAGKQDGAALAKASEALGKALAAGDRWPEALADDLAAAGKQLASAGKEADALAAARTNAIWQQYRGMFAAPQGLRSALARRDFAGAAKAAQDFAATVPGAPAAARATALADALARADAFAQALDKAIAANAVALAAPAAANGGPATLQATRWDRAGNQVSAVDPARRSAKEQAIPLTTPEAWLAVAEQVAGAEAGTRECFLGFVLLSLHADAAQAFLGQLQPGDDASGTGCAAYPLGAAAFDGLLRRVPEAQQAPWAPALRHELQAGQRLAAGLRALSERRNVAAAGHLDKLLAEHPHSLVVAVLP